MAIKNQAEILQNIQNGNSNLALKHLYDHTLSKVRNYVMKNSGSRDEANDVFQDAVIVFFQQVKEKKYDIRKDIDAYIYTVARNMWIDRARRLKKMQNYGNSEQYENHPDDQDQLVNLMDREKSQALLKVFEKLEESCQKILNYVIYEKKSMKEICQLFNFSSEDVAKTKHYRCKQYLTKLVKSDAGLVSLLRN